jgi:hypothetical protein
MNVVTAGNAVQLRRQFDRAEGETGYVSPSTAQMAVTDEAGATVALTETVTYLGGSGTETSVVVKATWSIPDDAHGLYVVTTKVLGALVGAHQETWRVRQRRLVVVPS